ncbi:hypothetical protein RMATCC62417_12630 [Rhizopus microsporus]|nr:hypothetical protein RMATCC62417_12630 [Rhizopus microsporus]
MSESESQQAKLVKLNVGGDLYLTYEVTLKKSLFFKNLLETEMQNNEKTDSGEILVDRCGKLFEHVLRYLRNGTIRWNKLDVELLEKLSEEVEFYQVEEMKRMIDEELEKRKNKEEDLFFIPVDKYTQKLNCWTYTKIGIIPIESFPEKYKFRTIIECTTSEWQCIRNIPDHIGPCECLDFNGRMGSITSKPAKYFLVSLKR